MKLIQLTKICLIIFCLTLCAAAQNSLVRFEKSIEAGQTAEVEKDLFNYVIANPKDAKGFALLAKMRLKQNRLNERSDYQLKHAQNLVVIIL